MTTPPSPSSNIPSITPGQARIQSFRVVPYLPDPLKPLMEIGSNLWWTWNYQAISLFSRLDRDLWDSTNHNPVKMLGAISQARPKIANYPFTTRRVVPCFCPASSAAFSMWSTCGACVAGSTSCAVAATRFA